MEMKELVAEFLKKCPKLAYEMKASDHNLRIEDGLLSPHHIEGDVFCHTMMVCLIAELNKLSDVIMMACLLHDVGKPAARVVFEEEKKVKYIGHEGLSVFIALDCIKKMGLNLSKRELSLLVNLISHHTTLYRIMESDKYEAKVLEKFKNNKELLNLLIQLSRCDALGRFSDGKMKVVSMEEKIQPLVDIIDESSFDRNYSNTLTLLIGPPLSGKTTWVKENRKDEVVISRDEIVLNLGGLSSYAECWKSVDQDLVDKEFNRQVTEAFKQKKNIIIDKTNCSLKSRRSVLGQASKLYKKKAVVFYTSYEELLVRGRERANSENKFVSERTIQEIMKSYYSPLYNEFDEIIEIFSL
jgi:predicted kinase